MSDLTLREASRQSQADVLGWLGGKTSERPNPGEDLLMGEEVQVVLARLEGRVESLTQMVEVRLQGQERDVEAYRSSAREEHKRLQQQVTQTAGLVTDLQQFKSRIVGIGIGLSLASGTISGVVVAFVSAINGG